jgi:hypothetical protein
MTRLMLIVESLIYVRNYVRIIFLGFGNIKYLGMI